ncbi:hypothetical protein HanPI659440_Chr15g0586331 [Helianthus annuus]|nr:hypothetical protein HanPI659440_Chr15g0586331 [Helianthus annuus]
MPAELGDSGGMLRKTSWKCSKGLKMIIKEKKPSLKLCEKSLPACDNLEAMMRKVMKQVVGDRDE